MYKIQANQSGTRSIEVSDLHLETIDKYQLLRNLVDSNGIIDEGYWRNSSSTYVPCSKRTTARTRHYSTCVSTSSTTVT